MKLIPGIVSAALRPFALAALRAGSRTATTALTFLMAAVAAWPLQGYGQTLAWSASAHGLGAAGSQPSNGDTLRGKRSAALDSFGNLIVVGASYNGLNNDFRTVKFAAADGSVMWDRTLVGIGNGDDVAYAVALDVAGNAIVTGFSGNGANFDFKTVKYAAADGSTLWEKTYNGAANNVDQAFAVAVDAAGNAIVTGLSHNGANNDFKTIKYAAADGSVLWEKTFNGAANNDDLPFAVAVDAAGNAFVTGHSSNGVNTDFKTIKYAAADGAMLWEKTFNGAANSTDQAHAVAVDAAGNAIVTGISFNGGNYDFKTLKYAAADGSVLWEKTFNGATNNQDYAYAVAVDAAGNAIVTGLSHNGANNDFKTIKYAASDGSVLWEKTFNGAGAANDHAFAVAVDASGDAVVTGSSWNGTSYDFKALKYAAADGTALWEGAATPPSLRAGQMLGNFLGNPVARDGAGNAIVTGYSFNGSNFDIRTLKYSAADGAVLWEKTFNGAANNYDYAYAVAVDPSGNAFVTGMSHNGGSYDFKTLKYASADGSTLWEKSFNGAANNADQALAVAVDASGNAIVTGLTYNGANYDFKTIKYAAADGSVLWEKTYNGPANSHDQAFAVAVDASGNAIVTGHSYSGASYDFKTIKYAAADGSVLWEKNFNGAANGQDESFAVAVDNAGNAIVTGYSYNGASNNDFKTLKYAAADGALLWEKTFNGAANNQDQAYAVAVDAAGNAIVTGYSSNGANTDFKTIKYAAVDGAVLWEKTFNAAANNNDQAYAVAVDAAGNAIVTGYSHNGTNFDFKTFKYAAADGAVLWEHTFNGSSNSNDQAFGVVATEGAVYVAGNCVNGGPPAICTLKISDLSVPGAPTIGTATAGNASVTVTFSAPSDGGSPITGYTATCGAQSASGTNSPITVTGLTNGTPVTCTVTATNAIGTGPASSASNSVTPATVPSAPTIGTATGGNASATVTFSANSDGGSAITDYTATCGAQSASGPTSPITVTGLTNGTPVTCTVTATNAVGTSAPSAASNSVTPATVPGAPTIGTATPGNASVSVAFTAPGDGGSAITGYTATCGAQSASGGTSPITVSGLTNGVPVTCTVTATNSVGTGPASAASNSVTPDGTAPDTGITAFPASPSNSASAVFTFLGSDGGGSGVASFSCSLDAAPFTPCASPQSYTGLAEGPHSFAVRAHDVAGNVDPTPATYNWTIDLTPPGLSFTSTPVITSANQGSYSVSGTCSDDGRTVSVQIGSVAANGTCGTPASGQFVTTAVDVSALASGTVSLGATLADAAGNSISITGSTTKDAEGPTLTLDTLDIINNANKAAYGISGTCESGGTNVNYTLAFMSVVSGSTSCGAGGTFVVTGLDVSNLNEGTVSVSITQSDALGNSTTTNGSVLKDTQVPIVTIDPPATITAANQATYLLTGTCSENGTAVTLSAGTVNGSVNCGTPVGGFQWTVNLTSLPEGPVAFSASLTDVGGNTATANAAGTKDSVALAPSITSPASGATVATNAAISGSGAESGATVTVKEGLATLCSGVAAAGGNWTCTPSLSPGSHTVTATQVDLAGNTSPASTAVTFTVSGATTTGLLSSSNPAEFGTSVTFTATVTTVGPTATGTITFRNGLTPLGTVSLTAGSAAFSTSALGLGTHAIAADYSGDGTNDPSSGTLAGGQVIVDTVAPTTTLTSTPSTLTNSPNASFQFTGNDGTGSGVTGFECKVDAASFAPCTSPANYTLADGAHTFEVRAVDAAGNPDPTPASYAWTIDASAPSVSLNGPYTGAAAVNSANQAAFTITGTCSESGRIVTVTIVGQGISATPTCNTGNFTTGPLNLSTLADGSYTVQAQHSDLAGNGTTVTTSLQKLTTAPMVSITGPAAITAANQAAYVVAGTCSENGRNVAVQVGSISTSAVCGTPTSGQYATPAVNATALAQGTVAISATHTSLVGNTATANANAVKDTVGPTLTLDALDIISNANKAAYAIGGTCESGGGSVAYSLTSGATVSGTVACSGGTFAASALNVTALTDGTVAVAVTQSDAVGNPASANGSVLKDTLNPSVTIDAPAVITAANQAAYTVSGTCSENGATVTLTVGGVGSTATCTTGAWQRVVDLTALAQGSVGITAALTDGTGNSATANATATKDSVATAPSITAPAASSTVGPNPTISGNGAESGATVTVREGTTTVCSATADSAGAWSCASTLAMGTHVVSATQVDVAGNTSPASASVTFSVFDGGTPGRLGNISARMQVLTGNDVLIGGFVIGGSSPKTVVVRARGPSLAPFGITSFLANPRLQLVRSSDQATLATNDDWQSASNAADVTASGFAPSDNLEAAILMTLPPGAYTAIVSGTGNTTGVGIVEVFEVDAPAVPLTNISARGFAQGGADVMIAGFVIQGNSSQTVLVRARGPSLRPFGITNPLPNPRLRLVRSSDQLEIQVNDDWRLATNQAAIAASGYAPGHDMEAAIMVSLPPGAYTAVVDGGIGVAIVEVFRLN